VNYVAMNPEGRAFDSSVEKGAPYDIRCAHKNKRHNVMCGFHAFPSILKESYRYIEWLPQALPASTRIRAAVKQRVLLAGTGWERSSLGLMQD
jgi:hypothetical protein